MLNKKLRHLTLCYVPLFLDIIINIDILNKEEIMKLFQNNRDYSGLNNIKDFFQSNLNDKRISVQVLYNNICNDIIIKYVISVLSSKIHESLGLIRVDQLFIDFYNIEKEYKFLLNESSAIEEHDVILRNNSFLAFPWRKDSLSWMFEKFPNDNFVWKEDENHSITLVKPFNIYFVNGGNHSIACAKIFNKDGIIKCNSAVDYSKILIEYDYNGEYFIDKNKRKINKPRNKELLDLFLLGKAIKEIEISEKKE